MYLNPVFHLRVGLSPFVVDVQMIKMFPVAPLERIFRKAGAERVSASAVDELREVIMEFADALSTEAVAAAKHAGRVTVKKEDIKLVSR
jgi:histone H3/H4